MQSSNPAHSPRPAPTHPHTPSTSRQPRPPAPDALLPQAWANRGAFPNLLLMRLDSNHLNGTLPSDLGMQDRGLQSLLVM